MDDLDLDDVIDPDDLIETEPVCCAPLLPPSAKSEAWWTALVLGARTTLKPAGRVSSVAHVAYRLGYARAVMGNPISAKATVGQLHEAIEAHFGPTGLEGIGGMLGARRQGPRAHQYLEQNTGSGSPRPNPWRIIYRKPATSPPSPASLQSEAEALRSLPGAVRRFWLYEPRVPPASQETAGERQLRLSMEQTGSWCGRLAPHPVTGCLSTARRGRSMFEAQIWYCSRKLKLKLPSRPLSSMAGRKPFDRLATGLSMGFLAGTPRTSIQRFAIGS